MNPIIPVISVISVFTVIPAIYGVSLKLAAKFLQYNRITWKQGFQFGLLVVICSSLIRAAFFGIGYTLPVLPGVLLGLASNWLIGSWFFSFRGLDNEGSRLGWGKSVVLTGLGLLFLCVAVALLVSLPMMLIHKGSAGA